MKYVIKVLTYMNVVDVFFGDFYELIFIEYLRFFN